MSEVEQKLQEVWASYEDLENALLTTENYNLCDKLSMLAVAVSRLQKAIEDERL